MNSPANELEAAFAKAIRGPEGPDKEVKSSE